MTVEERLRKEWHKAFRWGLLAAAVSTIGFATLFDYLNL